MIVVSLVASILSLAGVAWLLWRDAKALREWSERTDVPIQHSVSARVSSSIKAAIRRNEKAQPAFRTSVGYVRDVMANAERESAKIRFRK